MNVDQICMIAMQMHNAPTHKDHSVAHATRALLGMENLAQVMHGFDAVFTFFGRRIPFDSSKRVQCNN